MYYSPSMLSSTVAFLSTRTVLSKKYILKDISIEVGSELYNKYHYSFIVPALVFWIAVPILGLLIMYYHHHYHKRIEKGTNVCSEKSLKKLL